uniref:DoxX family protein n=1 Tax=viral metagenome TaxID=1070528 RepID=A0A6C0F5W2_9ZZZZ|tara:strand:- start:4044 stop:4421 length:378 start_codon:yes stop_codon:yes gene_type:complete
MEMPIIAIKFLTVIMFLISGFYKLYDPSIGINKLMKCQKNLFSNNLNLVKTIVFLAGIWEVIASLLVLYKNDQNCIYALYSLVVFTILATLLCHFPPVGFTYYPFISNITTIGGLLALIKLIQTT